MALKFSKEDTFDKVNSLIRACNNSEYLKYNSQVDFRKVHLNGLKKVLSAVSFEDILKRIVDVVSEQIVISDITLNISVSLGAAIYKMHGDEPEHLLRIADQAMYQAKKSGKNRYYIAQENA